jgi:hypothetical protein
VGELLLEVFEEWGLTAKEPVLVTDNASNMVIAACLFLCTASTWFLCLPAYFDRSSS